MLVKNNDQNQNDFHRLYRFENGYGASIAKNILTMGGRQGLYELAIIRWTGPDIDNWSFGPPVFRNQGGTFAGWITLKEAEKLLEAIKVLPEPQYWVKWFLKHIKK